MKHQTPLATLCLILTAMVAAPEAGALELDIDEPGYDEPGYRARSGGSRDRSKFNLGFSIAEGVYFHVCSDSGCKAATAAPADFEFLLGYRFHKNWQLDLAAVWELDFNHYGGVNSLFGFRPGIRLLLPSLYQRIWYLRAAVPILFGVGGDADSYLIGFMLGVGVEWRFRVLGFFAEVDFSPYFVQVSDNYYVVPVQGRIGLSFRF